MRLGFRFNFVVLVLLVVLAASLTASGQVTAVQKAERGSQIAKAGFKNEDEIAAKFNNWTTDAEARGWLTAMNFRLDEIASVSAGKPHGEKADVEVVVKTKKERKKRKESRSSLSRARAASTKSTNAGCGSM